MQTEYLYWQEVGLTPEAIYRDKVHNQYNISRSTFYRWLGINAKAKLKAIKKEEDKQIKLF